MRKEVSLGGWIFIRGKLVCRTGLHIGAHRELAAAGGGRIDAPVVRGIDAPVVREPLEEEGNGPGNPYIPGTSLRGKLRFLLERKIGSEENTPSDFWKAVATVGGKPVRIHTCEREDCRICRLFGNVPLSGQEESGTSLPSSLYVSDLRLATSPEPGGPGRSVQRRKEPKTERKVEASVDRSTAHTNPREIERILQGSVFSLKLRYRVRDLGHLREDLGHLLGALALLEDDALGGHGSRGYGAVDVLLEEIEARREERSLSLREELSGKPLREVGIRMEEITCRLEELFRQAPLETPVPGATTGKGNEQVFLARLAFTSPLHVGEVGIGLEGCAAYLSSDILFSGLCHAWAQTYGTPELERLLERFAGGDPPFLLSSAFPYWKEEIFFPRPQILHFSWKEGVEELKEEERKLFQDIRWLPLPSFARWVGRDDTGFRFSEADYQELKKSEENLKKACQSYFLPRLRLDRIEARSNLFLCKVVRLRRDSGLFCLVRSAEEEMLKRLEGALRVLGEIGLGGERSAGCGAFALNRWQNVREIQGLQELLKEGTDPAYLTLSLYHPSSQELEGMAAGHLQGYELVERGGWVDSPGLRRPTRKRPCRMFSEGSVFSRKWCKGPPRGSLVKVAQLTHPVYRYGFFFPVGAVPPPERD